ncbi:MAG TPA: sulfotransferase [Candidatus Sulfotelmatobacter sp.]|nr:sulfotransferase [Candidatus Sulfotelmatobacter sp.]
MEDWDDEQRVHRAVQPGLPKGDTAPVIVFGTGGSGTRAVATFLSSCGIWMGRVNGSQDALAFCGLLETHINALIRKTHRLDYDLADIDAGRREAVMAAYRRAATLHREGMASGARWGFKNPRHIFALPVLDNIFGNALFVHVLRDGRDMLLSENRNQAKKHFVALFGRRFGQTGADMARFWAKTNLDARAFGARQLRERYVAVRIEDMCAGEPTDAVRSTCEALGLEKAVVSRALGGFEPRTSFGRWRNQPDLEVADEQFETALRVFGYN